jgi:superfamily II DNA or RNA helicase
MRAGYSARLEAECAAQMRNDFRSMLASPGLAKPTRVLATLVSLGVIDCRIAWIGPAAAGRPKRLFHDKMGIFADEAGNRLAFKGSMNETWPGLALDGNLESVDVFASWVDQREAQRIDEEQAYFDRLWRDEFPNVQTRLIPEAALSEIVNAADAANWPDLVDEITADLARATEAAGGSAKVVRTPRKHQIEALEAWKARGRRGILAHATGSGKTFTALCAMLESQSRSEVPLVIVPSDLLLKQWHAEVLKVYEGQGVQILLCGGGHATWRSEGRLRIWSRKLRPGQPPRVIISTLQTASAPEFSAVLQQGEHLFLVADEVHRLGATEAQNVLALDTGPRLGLSATPERAGDPSGTDAILNYFQGIVPPPFTLEDAIAADALTRYAFHVHTVSLSEAEQRQWDQESDEIKRVAARLKNSTSADTQVSQDRLKLLLIRRSRIVKSADAKISAAVEILRQHFQPGQRWIVYCDNQIQLGNVLGALQRAEVSPVYEYHTGMRGDPAATLHSFTALGGICVSIKCLDEGVDIPAVSHALILASSKNPREYIQRRGRVLRKAIGKSLSHIHDVVVTPRFDSDRQGDVPILEGELSRAITFGRSAINPGCVADLELLAIRHGLNWTHTASHGFESDVEDES